MVEVVVSADLIKRLSDRLAMATPGAWMVQDGCSWRRIGTHMHDGDVLRPTNHPRDNHPDLVAADGRLYANLMLIVEVVNALPAILATLRAAPQSAADAADPKRNATSQSGLSQSGEAWEAEKLRAHINGMMDAATICGTLAETTYDDTEGFAAATGCEAAIHARVFKLRAALAPAAGGEGL